ncbi:MAG: hypothetical protein U9N36_07390 [Euryarchaeota archaeon]|nr:hypothetical protein [Euryarchaeota archaeon]
MYLNSFGCGMVGAVGVVGSIYYRVKRFVQRVCHPLLRTPENH